METFNGEMSVVSPGVLLRVFEVLGDKSKVLAHLQPQVRLGHPAIVGVDGVVLSQLPGNEPARWKRLRKKCEDLNSAQLI